MTILGKNLKPGMILCEDDNQMLITDVIDESNDWKAVKLKSLSQIRRHNNESIIFLEPASSYTIL